MPFKQENIKLIFGLKVRQLRQEKQISLSEMANKAGLSVSYLNEIEKGKKYPKNEKIFALAEALQIDYDSLISLKLSKKLEPLAHLFNSNILNDLPLEMFGVEPGDLFDLLSEAPDKLSAFISTIIEIGRSYDMKVEEFYFSVLRSYQEMHDNYFPELEKIANDFLSQIGSQTLNEEFLANYLRQNYGYQIEEFDESTHPEITSLRSVISQKNERKLLINKKLYSEQKAFTYAREIGYRVLGLKNRPSVSPVLKAVSFEQVLNNFKASYFAGSILIPRQKLIDNLEAFFKQKQWSNTGFMNMMEQFCCTPEMFVYRLTNVMPSHFGINQLYFLRFNNQTGSELFFLAKEIHLAKLHIPHATVLHEYYCRRWVSLTVLKELWKRQSTAQNTAVKPFAQAQISEYIGTNHKYFVAAIAIKSSLNQTQNSSLTIGFAIDDKLREIMGFLDDPTLETRQVSETCERCSLTDCADRIKEATIYNRQKNQKALIEAALNV
jgi:XRE family transcriptional regulator, fatty acid utilization regulator